MTDGNLFIDLNVFLKDFIQSPSHMMWFLGAGTSVSANLPTANDIIWDLKYKYYCIAENQTINEHDRYNKAIRASVQAYLNSKSGFPELWAPEEYSFYFDLLFKGDYQSQQRYLQEVLSSQKISLNIGHRALGGLLADGKTKIVFTTNFDEVIEMAYAKVSGRALTTFHLEGSYAALEALNTESFPFYAKVHGDFRYQSVKNLAKDLIDNDREIQKCFLAASSRYGLIVSGYSGRDNNVMSMLMEAIAQNNAFPFGLYWMVTKRSSVGANVKDMIKAAQQNKVKAYIVESGTYDQLLSRIWRLLPGKTKEIAEKVRASAFKRVMIRLPEPGQHYPVIRLNALPIVQMPSSCGEISLKSPVPYEQLKENARIYNVSSPFIYTDKIYFWGNVDDAIQIIPKDCSYDTSAIEFTRLLNDRVSSGYLLSFIKKGICEAICSDKPFLYKSGFIIPSDLNHSLLSILKQTLGQGNISGLVPKTNSVKWIEALKINLESRGDQFWLLLEPKIFIEPVIERKNSKDFMISRMKNRYNLKAHDLLNAWISMLFNCHSQEAMASKVVTVTYKPNADFRAEFQIRVQTAFSSRSL